MNDFSISPITAGLSQFNNKEINSTSLDQSEFLAVASESFKSLQSAKSLLIEGTDQKATSQPIGLWANRTESTEKIDTIEDSVKDRVRELMDKITSLLQDQKEK